MTGMFKPPPWVIHAVGIVTFAACLSARHEVSNVYLRAAIAGAGFAVVFGTVRVLTRRLGRTPSGG